MRMRGKGACAASLGEERVAEFGIGTSPFFRASNANNFAHLLSYRIRQVAWRCPFFYRRTPRAVCETRETVAYFNVSLLVSARQQLDRPTVQLARQFTGPLRHRSLLPRSLPSCFGPLVRAMITIRRLAKRFSKQTLSEVKVCMSGERSDW